MNTDDKKIVYSPRPPCGKDCADRKPGCGVTCEKWIAYVEKRNAVYKERVKITEQYAMTKNTIQTINAKHYRGKTNKRAKGGG